MRMFQSSVIVAFGLMLAVQGALGADDPAPVGISWKGTAKRFGPPDDKGNRIHSTDAHIKIQTRDEEKFTGILSLQNGKRIWEIQGTISDRGAVRFTLAVRLKTPDDDDNPGDGTGRAVFIGAIKEGKLKGKFSIPKNTGPGYRVDRFGEMELTLEP